MSWAGLPSGPRVDGAYGRGGHSPLPVGGFSVSSPLDIRVRQPRPPQGIGPSRATTLPGYDPLTTDQSLGRSGLKRTGATQLGPETGPLVAPQHPHRGSKQSLVSTHGTPGNATGKSAETTNTTVHATRHPKLRHAIIGLRDSPRRLYLCGSWRTLATHISSVGFFAYDIFVHDG